VVVRTFPIAKHKTWSHSCIGEFVQEAYHHQGLHEYDNDKCYGWKQTCSFCHVEFLIAAAEILSVATAHPAIAQILVVEFPANFGVKTAENFYTFFITSKTRTCAARCHAAQVDHTIVNPLTVAVTNASANLPLRFNAPDSMRAHRPPSSTDARANA
jgi:hypothetical protein